jgi:hypothetical protein
LILSQSLDKPSRSLARLSSLVTDKIDAFTGRIWVPQDVTAMDGKRTASLYLSEDNMLRAGVLVGPRCAETIDQMFRVPGVGDYLMGGVSENGHGQRLYFPVKKRFPNLPMASLDRALDLIG